jgi:hypothetical protein
MDDLQAQLKRMELAKATPEQFGLAVRSHPGALLITARNKMGSGMKFPLKVGLAENLIETTRVVLDPSQLQKNMAAGEALIRTAFSKKTPETFSRGYLFPKIDAELVLELLRGFRADPKSPPSDPLTDPKLIGDYIHTRQASELAFWDVFLASSTAKKFDPTPIGGFNVYPFELSVDPTALTEKGVYAFSGASRRIGSAEDESVGLSSEQIAQARENFRLSRADKKLPTTVNPRFYRQVPGRRPLIIIRLVKPKIVGVDGVKQYAEDVLVWGLSFPSSAIDGGTVEYVVNTIRMREMFGEEEIEEETRGDPD